MAQAPKVNADRASFVRDIVSDPKAVPDVMLLYGYLGASSEEGHERLYLSPDLTNYVEVPTGGNPAPNGCPQGAGSARRRHALGEERRCARLQDGPGCGSAGALFRRCHRRRGGARPATGRFGRTKPCRPDVAPARVHRAVQYTVPVLRYRDARLFVRRLVLVSSTRRGSDGSGRPATGRLGRTELWRPDFTPARVYRAVQYTVPVLRYRDARLFVRRLVLVPSTCRGSDGGGRSAAGRRGRPSRCVGRDLPAALCRE